MEKLCCKCKKISEFSKNGKVCKSCKKTYDREYVLKNYNKKKLQCLEYNKTHKEEKKRYDIDYRKNNSEKRANWKLERKVSGKSYLEARKSFIKRKYKITLEEYEELLSKQNNKCLICGNESSRHKNSILYIDHCHTSGKIRGLLCHHCNCGLGNFMDNTFLLEKAIEYLKLNEK